MAKITRQNYAKTRSNLVKKMRDILPSVKDIKAAEKQIRASFASPEEAEAEIQKIETQLFESLERYKAAGLKKRTPKGGLQSFPELETFTKALESGKLTPTQKIEISAAYTRVMALSPDLRPEILRSTRIGVVRTRNQQWYIVKGYVDDGSLDISKLSKTGIETAIQGYIDGDFNLTESEKDELRKRYQQEFFTTEDPFETGTTNEDVYTTAQAINALSPSYESYLRPTSTTQALKQQQKEKGLLKGQANAKVWITK